MQLLTRVLETRGNLWTEVSAVGRTKRAEGSSSETRPLMWRREGGVTCSQLNSTILTGLWRNKSATRLSQRCCDCSSFCVFLSAPPLAFFRHRTSSHLMSHQLLRGSTSKQPWRLAESGCVCSGFSNTPGLRRENVQSFSPATV